MMTVEKVMKNLVEEKVFGDVVIDLIKFEVEVDICHYNLILKVIEVDLNLG